MPFSAHATEQSDRVWRRGGLPNAAPNPNANANASPYSTEPDRGQQPYTTNRLMRSYILGGDFRLSEGV